MSKKRSSKLPTEKMIVIFVEGDADELMINRLLDYYRSRGWRRPSGVRVENTHGTPVERKMKQGLERIRQSNKHCSFNAVCCEYDTDIYEKQIQQKPNWKKIEGDLKTDFSVIEFCRLEAKTSIEDWMLDDMDGLLKGLSLPNGTLPSGKSGQDKVASLFRKKNIAYSRSKGKKNIEPVIAKLDMNKIRQARKTELNAFEKMLGVDSLFK